MTGNTPTSDDKIHFADLDIETAKAEVGRRHGRIFTERRIRKGRDIPYWYAIVEVPSDRPSYTSFTRHGEGATEEEALRKAFDTLGWFEKDVCPGCGMTLKHNEHRAWCMKEFTW